MKRHLEIKEEIRNIKQTNSNMPSNLYFVDSIFLSRGRGREDNYVNLISTDKTEDGYYPTFFVACTESQLRLKNSRRKIEDGATIDSGRNVEEGDYVIYDERGEDGYLFADGNVEPYAIQITERGEAVREALARIEPDLNKADLTERDLNTLINADTVYSYHVNVGHGNCSLILIKSEEAYVLWMVDCSIIERGNSASTWQNHQSELKTCLDSIGREVRSFPHISRFFLTHMHYDHYSGVNYLYNNNYIDNRTIYYINHYYDCNNDGMTSFLKSLKDNHATIIEPVSAYSLNGVVRILYPENRIYKKCPKRAKEPAVDNANKASAVFRFAVNNRSMVFPGDLEIDGFDNMAGSRKCAPWLHSANYYAISHHGSFNGHPAKTCSGTGYHKTILKCILFKLKKAVLMGRDGAYTTMFDPKVVRDFDFNERLVTTDMKNGRTPLKYLRLDWISGDVKYYF